MAGPSHLKTFYSLHISSTKSPSSSSSSSSSSTLSSMKLKTLAHTLILSHVCRIARALSKAKSILSQVLKEIKLIQLIEPLKISKSKNKNKLFFGSFRLHYNWCSSHVVPTSHLYRYYDSTWDSVVATECGDDVAEDQLSGYLQWLEDRKVHDHEKKSSGGAGHSNDIDKLADMFIANCHEKFKLEKQESYRRFQEMMARSV